MTSKISPEKFILSLLEAKRVSKLESSARQKGVASDRDPWMSGRCTSPVWLHLYSLYLWSLSNDKDSPQAYRQAAEDITVYNSSQKKSWIRALKWIDANGDPTKNERYNKWYASQDMEEY